MYLKICTALANHKADNGYGYWDMNNFLVKLDDAV